MLLPKKLIAIVVSIPLPDLSYSNKDFQDQLMKIKVNNSLFKKLENE